MANRVRKESPDVKVGRYEIDVRGHTSRDFDRAEPEFKHVWLSKGSSEDDLARLGAEVCKDEKGRTVDNRMSMLVKIPKDEFLAPYKRQSQQSVDQMGSIRNDDGTRAYDDDMFKFRNPKVRKPRPE